MTGKLEIDVSDAGRGRARLAVLVDDRLALIAIEPFAKAKSRIARLVGDAAGMGAAVCVRGGDIL